MDGPGKGRMGRTCRCETGMGGKAVKIQGRHNAGTGSRDMEGTIPSDMAEPGTDNHDVLTDEGPRRGDNDQRNGD